MIRSLLVASVLLGALACNAPADPPAAPSPEEAATVAQALRVSRVCTSSLDCRSPLLRCTSETGTCNRPPGCRPGDICPAICYGTCELRSCGGFAALPCPEGQRCVDDPRDGCDPRNGGADCGGICLPAPRAACDDPARTYVSHDPDQCAVIRFLCVVGKQPFSDRCGCGCVATGG